MIAKRILFLAIMCISNSFHLSCNEEQPAATAGTILSDVVTMTDDIAEIIMTCKTEKDPKKIKELVSHIVKVLANLIESIIEKRKLKKIHRSISINEFDFADISGKSLEEEIEQIVYAIIQKAGVSNDH